MHFSGLGIITLGLDLRGVRSFQDIAAAVHSYISSSRFDGKLIAGFGIMDELLDERRLPNRHDLDAMCADYPMVLAKGDGHSTVANTRGLAYLGLKPGLAGAETDEAGQLTGIIRKEANFFVYSRFSRLFGLSRSMQGLANAGNLAASRGVTGIHAAEGLGFPGDTDVKGVMTAAPYLQVDVTVYFQTRNVDRAVKYGLPRIGSCFSTAVDGSTSSGTAAFFEPILTGNGGRGVVYFTQEELDAYVLKAHSAGLQMNLHAIGDRAIEMVITAYERALRAVSGADHRHRIEHCTFPTRGQVERIAAAGVSVSTQPSFFGLDGLDFRASVAGLGEARARRSMPLAELFRAGVCVSGSSDAPVTDIDPLAGIQAAVCHPVPEQSVSVFQAITMFTANAARNGFADRSKGTLVEGKDADFVVLDRDPFTVAPEEIGRIGISGTYVRGRACGKQRLTPAGLVLGMVRRGLGMGR